MTSLENPSSATEETKRKVIITGGAGTVGQTFIQQYREEFEFHNISRNEANIQKLKARYPEVDSHVADIQDLDHLSRLFNKIKPDIVIHTAAFKHVNFAELNPSRTVEVNIVGSLNVAKASIRAGVPIVVGISTDKACQPENIYGYSKKILEQTFLEHYNEQSRFICTRFANVACSSGSVIPFWIDSARSGETLKHAYYSDNKRYILLHSDEFGQQRVTEPLSSLTAEYMSEQEMSALYANYATPANAGIKFSSVHT